MTIMEMTADLAEDLEKYRNGEISASQLKLTKETTSTIFRGIMIAIAVDGRSDLQIEHKS